MPPLFRYLRASVPVSDAIPSLELRSFGELEGLTKGGMNLTRQETEEDENEEDGNEGEDDAAVSSLQPVLGLQFTPTRPSFPRHDATLLNSLIISFLDRDIPVSSKFTKTGHWPPTVALFQALNEAERKREGQKRTQKRKQEQDQGQSEEVRKITEGSMPSPSSTAIPSPSISNQAYFSQKWRMPSYDHDAHYREVVDRCRIELTQLGLGALLKKLNRGVRLQRWYELRLRGVNPDDMGYTEAEWRQLEKDEQALARLHMQQGKMSEESVYEQGQRGMVTKKEIKSGEESMKVEEQEEEDQFDDERDEEEHDDEDEEDEEEEWDEEEDEEFGAVADPKDVDRSDDIAPSPKSTPGPLNLGPIDPHTPLPHAWSFWTINDFELLIQHESSLWEYYATHSTLPKLNTTPTSTSNTPHSAALSSHSNADIISPDSASLSSPPLSPSWSLDHLFHESFRPLLDVKPHRVRVLSFLHRTYNVFENARIPEQRAFRDEVMRRARLKAEREAWPDQRDHALRQWIQQISYEDAKEILWLEAPNPPGTHQPPSMRSSGRRARGMPATSDPLMRYVIPVLSFPRSMQFQSNNWIFYTPLFFMMHQEREVYKMRTMLERLRDRRETKVMLRKEEVERQLVFHPNRRYIIPETLPNGRIRYKLSEDTPVMLRRYGTMELRIDYIFARLHDTELRLAMLASLFLLKIGEAHARWIETKPAYEEWLRRKEERQREKSARLEAQRLQSMTKAATQRLIKQVEAKARRITERVERYETHPAQIDRVDIERMQVQEYDVGHIDVNSASPFVLEAAWKSQSSFTPQPQPQPSATSLSTSTSITPSTPSTTEPAHHDPPTSVANDTVTTTDTATATATTTLSPVDSDPPLGREHSVMKRIRELVSRSHELHEDLQQHQQYMDKWQGMHGFTPDPELSFPSLLRIHLPGAKGLSTRFSELQSTLIEYETLIREYVRQKQEDGEWDEIVAEGMAMEPPTQGWRPLGPMKHEMDSGKKKRTIKLKTGARTGRDSSGRFTGRSHDDDDNDPLEGRGAIQRAIKRLPRHVFDCFRTYTPRNSIPVSVLDPLFDAAPGRDKDPSHAHPSLKREKATTRTSTTLESALESVRASRMRWRRLIAGMDGTLREGEGYQWERAWGEPDYDRRMGAHKALLRTMEKRQQNESHPVVPSHIRNRGNLVDPHGIYLTAWERAHIVLKQRDGLRHLIAQLNPSIADALSNLPSTAPASRTDEESEPWRYFERPSKLYVGEHPLPRAIAHAIAPMEVDRLDKRLTLFPSVVWNFWHFQIDSIYLRAFPKAFGSDGQSHPLLINIYTYKELLSAYALLKRMKMEPLTFDDVTHVGPMDEKPHEVVREMEKQYRKKRSEIIKAINVFKITHQKPKKLTGPHSASAWYDYHLSYYRWHLDKISRRFLMQLIDLRQDDFEGRALLAARRARHLAEIQKQYQGKLKRALGRKQEEETAMQETLWPIIHQIILERVQKMSERMMKQAKKSQHPARVIISALALCLQTPHISAHAALTPTSVTGSGVSQQDVDMGISVPQVGKHTYKHINTVLDASFINQPNMRIYTLIHQTDNDKQQHERQRQPASIAQQPSLHIVITDVSARQIKMMMESVQQAAMIIGGPSLEIRGRISLSPSLIHSDYASHTPSGATQSATAHPTLPSSSSPSSSPATATSPSTSTIDPSLPVSASGDFIGRPLMSEDTWLVMDLGGILIHIFSAAQAFPIDQVLAGVRIGEQIDLQMIANMTGTSRGGLVDGGSSNVRQWLMNGEKVGSTLVEELNNAQITRCHSIIKAVSMEMDADVDSEVD